MAQRDLPANATALWRWMHRHRVTLEELAEKVGCTPVYIGNLRRGVARPSDDLKIKIERETLAWERRHGIKSPEGVLVAAWFERAEVA